MKIILFIAIAGLLPAATPDPRITQRAGIILAARCSGCHNKRYAERGINVMDRKVMIKVGVLQPSDENSVLLHVIESGRMPLHAPPLAPDEVAVIRQWIIEGARQFKRK